MTGRSAARETPTYNPADERPRPDDAFLADCAGVGGAGPRGCLLQSCPGAIEVDRRGAFREHAANVAVASPRDGASRQCSVRCLSDSEALSADETGRRWREKARSRIGSRPPSMAILSGSTSPLRSLATDSPPARGE